MSNKQDVVNKAEASRSVLLQSIEHTKHLTAEAERRVQQHRARAAANDAEPEPEPPLPTAS